MFSDHTSLTAREHNDWDFKRSAVLQDKANRKNPIASMQPTAA
jgi:hypothetical protein